MSIRGTFRLGAIAGMLLLPLICLCQFVPGQAEATPYLLLFPRPHIMAAALLTDEQIADLAFSTGQAVSVTDEGDLALGYAGDAAQAGSGPGVQRPGAPPEQNPQVDAVVPLPRGLTALEDTRGLAGPSHTGAPQQYPAPLERPPRDVAVRPA
ncbi:MAG TPA: hypothetical protein VM536_21930 [Chloroflexia bacterium]|nr:hypothetical protein [Chloroflexia bacterium]